MFTCLVNLDTGPCCSVSVLLGVSMSKTWCLAASVLQLECVWLQVTENPIQIGLNNPI